MPLQSLPTKLLEKCRSAMSAEQPSPFLLGETT
ncbi:hypothetical protein PMI30_01359 [Pseudomonas sp. GM50]|nr:hypothetical protein PMI30_01359 [Pseudomonas sp. GM50]